MNDTLTKLKSRGYWEVKIRPADFKENRIGDLQTCKETLRELKVSLRGWSFPFYNISEPPTNGINYVEQALDWEDKIEFMRYYQSGQFVHYSAMSEDWQEQSRWLRIKAKPGEFLSIIGCLYLFTEIYEFASRLANKGMLGDFCKISITLYGNRDRTLTMLDPGRLLFAKYTSAIDVIPRERDVATPDLITKSAEFALDDVVWVFQRYNWDNVPRGVLQDDQKKLLERRL